jgi:cellulose synthase/poly-beta-1,6-N-acetylglucosamine synthase-like glycosyltransferase
MKHARILVKAFGLRRARRRAVHASAHRLRGVYSSPAHPFLTVLDVAKGGRARALNIGLAYAHHPLFLAMDTSTVLERDTLIQLALPFYENTDTLVVGGVVRPSNGCVIRGGALQAARVPKSTLARFQAVEHLRGMLAGWLGWNLLDSLYIVSGALGLFSREVVLAVGGYRPATRGEDMDLVMRVQRWAGRRGRKLAVRFMGNAVGWAEVPESLWALARERAREHRGLAESLWLNRELLLNTRFTLHHGLAFCFQVLVELIGPVVEICGLVLTIWLAATGQIQAPFAVLFLATYVAGGTIVSLMSATIERFSCPRYRGRRAFESLSLAALIESFGYRQFVAACRVWGLVTALGHLRRLSDRSRLAAPRPAAAVDHDRRHAA